MPADMPDGPFSVQLNLVDMAGNRSQVESPGWNLDRRAPEMDGISEWPARFTTGIARFAVTMSEQVSTVTMRLNGEMVPLAAHVFDGVRDHVTFEYPVLPESRQGTADIQITATDFSGNEVQRLVNSVSIDTQKPSVTSVSADIRNLSTGSFKWGLSINEPIINAVARFAGIPLDTTVSSDNGQFLLILSGIVTPDFPQGPASLMVNFSDLAGNIGTFSDSDFGVDTVPGSIRLNAVADPVRGSGDFDIEFDYSELAATVSASILGRPLVPVSRTAISGGEHWVYRGKINSDDVQGTASLTIVVQDRAGNSSTATSSIFVDTQAPAIQELPRNPGPLTFGQYDLPVLISESGTAIAASMNGVILTESSRVPSGSGEVVAMRYLVDSATPQGQNSIRLTATDRAGNRTQTDIN
ncbi:hypothetical protein EBR96_10070, partial [bacterium]|nr:hypothetical protein [bacterium]